MRESTPSIVMTGEPAPVIFAPIALSMLARSSISGSQAAHSMMVVPSARAAAESTFAVPRTVEPLGPPRKTCAPRRRVPGPPGASAVM